MQPLMKTEQDASYSSEEASCRKIENLKQLGKIDIVLVKNKYDPNHVVWKRMMEERHYLRSGKLFGRQMRYLVESSEQGWIGGFGFSSASWRLKERDRRIAWSKTGEDVDLDRIVCNSRFLILPEFGVPNAASHVMSQCIRRLAGDWENRYGVRPRIVETFVDSERFTGTCYRASNWIYLGETSGRGRSDRHHEKSVSHKFIFAYELEKGSLKEVLSLDKKEQDWAFEEFQYAQMPNGAKKKRLLTIVRDFYAKPRGSIPSSCEGSAKLKGAYRFFGDSEVKYENILGSHAKQSVERAKGHKVVLSVQDTTDLDYSSHPAAKGLGYLVSGHGKSGSGFVLHDTVLFTTGGLPLGVLDGQIWVRNKEEEGKSQKRAQKPIGEKESYKWLKSFEVTEKAQQKYPGTKFVSVSDRESDIYELFELARRSNSSFLARSFQNRLMDDGFKVWDSIEGEAFAGIKVVSVPRAKGEKSSDVSLEIRFREVNLCAPSNKKNLAAVNLWAISAKEKDPPEGKEALQWNLLTDVRTESFEEACERVDWYTQRFKIEVFHRILKSGCRVEDRRLESYESLKRCLAIDMVVAWRIYYLTMLGRETPDIGCDFFLMNLNRQC